MSAPKRFASVDALRGLTVAAMLLVNNPGDWGHVFWPLSHAAWHGCTPTDLIFPFFLFIVGVSLSLAFGARIDAQAPRGPMIKAVLTRAGRIIALGLVLHLLAWWIMAKPEFRLMGVLQRIGLCFAVAGVAAIWLKSRTQWLLLGSLLLTYGALLLLGPDLSKEANIASRLDAAVLGRWAYEWHADTGLGHDPEGLVSTLGALATCLLGVQAGHLLRSSKLQALFALGLLATVSGWALSTILPFNKQLWTPSFVLWTGGLATLCLLLAHRLMDSGRMPPWGRAFGVNAIAAYAGAWMCTVLLEGLGWMRPVYTHGFAWLEPLVGPHGQSLAFAMVFVGVWAVVVRVMWHHRLIIKV